MPLVLQGEFCDADENQNCSRAEYLAGKDSQGIDWEMHRQTRDSIRVRTSSFLVAFRGSLINGSFVSDLRLILTAAIACRHPDLQITTII